MTATEPISATEHERINKFIELFRGYQKEVESQRLRGLNDFNIFTTLLEQHDEVRLHSQFLSYLLNPRADHYQGDLFLRLFLEQCGWSDFFPNLKSCQVHKERKHIDIYITDGSRHLIIENKIYAGDRPKQIKRYIEKFKDANTPEDIRVMYLSLDREGPSDYSLYENQDEKKNGYKVNGNGDHLIAVKDGEEQKEKYQFKSIHYDKYDKEIREWLDKAHKQVANITNLSLGIRQYIEVIDKLNGTYKDKVMKIVEYLKGEESKGKLSKAVEAMEDISVEYTDLRKEYIGKFWDAVKGKLEVKQKELRKQGTGHEELEIKIEKKEMKRLKEGKGYGIPLRLRLSGESKLLFCCEYNSEDYKFRNLMYGIIPWPWEKMQERTEELSKNNEIKKLLKELESSPNFLPDGSDWWLKYCCYCEGSLFQKIVEDGTPEEAAGKFVEKFMGAFNDYKEVMIAGENILKEQEK